MARNGRDLGTIRVERVAVICLWLFRKHAVQATGELIGEGEGFRRVGKVDGVVEVVVGVRPETRSRCRKGRSVEVIAHVGV